MKTLIITLSLLTAVLMGTGFRKAEKNIDHAEKVKTESCLGYTVIEAGKGIDCKGDTIKLVKVNGSYRTASLCGDCKDIILSNK